MAAFLRSHHLLSLYCLSYVFEGVLAVSKTVPLSLNRREHRVNASSISIEGERQTGEYYASILIGTPPQAVDLLLDTGSSDTWLVGPNLCNPCLGGQFNISLSSTSNLLPELGNFNESYFPPKTVTGQYITDVFRLGALVVNSLTMAVASSITPVGPPPAGILGLGLDSREVLATEKNNTYKNLPDQLVSQGLIPSKAYSLFLNDFNSSSGTLLLGGYDEDKFSGDLLMLPLQVDPYTGLKNKFLVSWTSLSLRDSSGSVRLEANGTNQSVPLVLLDSGYTFIMVPTTIFNFLKPTFGVINNTYVSCALQKEAKYLEFGLGGSNGPVISVSYSELAIPLRQPLNSTAGEPLCQFGLADGGSKKTFIFGEAFLRSAYVLFDLDTLAAGLAQAKWNSSLSNVREYHGRFKDHPRVRWPSANSTLSTS